jgi:hypothetical protein
VAAEIGRDKDDRQRTRSLLKKIIAGG